MIDMRREEEHFDTLYSRHTPGKSHCTVSIDNLSKARKRLRDVLKTFDLAHRVRGAKVLDIGCGLGYFAEAFRLEGANVVALDVSSKAVRLVKTVFPGIDARCVLFPQAFETEERFDIVWILDISTLNTFDVAEMNQNVIVPATNLLKPGGVLIVGWHSDFSGNVTGNWSHWPLKTIRDLRKILRFSGPRVVQVRLAALTWLTIVVCRIIGKSCPIYFARGRASQKHQPRMRDLPNAQRQIPGSPAA